MTVFIEVVFINNFAFNFILLFSVVKIIRIKYKKWRLLLSDAFGTAIAIFIPLCNFSVVLSVFVKLCLSVGIILILAKYKSKKQFLAAMFLFYALTFAMGGILFGIFYMFKVDFSLQNDLSVISNNPLGLYVGGALLFVFLIRNIVAYIGIKRACLPFVYDVEIIIGDVAHSLNGFLDSGNLLLDGNLPVIIVVSATFKKIILDAVAESLIRRNNSIKNAHYVDFSTLSSGKNKMFVFNVDSIRVNGIHVNALIGVADETVPAKGETDILLNGNMVL